MTEEAIETTTTVELTRTRQTSIETTTTAERQLRRRTRTSKTSTQKLLSTKPESISATNTELSVTEVVLSLRVYFITIDLIAVGRVSESRCGPG